MSFDLLHTFYKIVPKDKDDTNCYVSYTTQSMDKCKKQHENKYKNYIKSDNKKVKLYEHMKEKGGTHKFEYVVLCEAYSDSVTEMNEKLRDWFDRVKPTLNDNYKRKIVLKDNDHVIYKISCNMDGKEYLYIGGTTNYEKAMIQHRSNCKSDSYELRENILYKTMRDMGGLDECDVEVLEIYNVDKLRKVNSLKERKDYWYKKLKDEKVTLDGGDKVRTFYKICCKDADVESCYVGRTTNFEQRMKSHRANSSSNVHWLKELKLYKTINQHGGWTNWKMERLETITCEDKEAEVKREEYWYKLLGADLNTIHPR